jgi:site-specific recombinase XerD
MFELLFERPHALRRHLNGPMVEERRHYLRRLLDQGMAPPYVRTIAQYLLVAAHYLRLAHRPGEVVRYAEVEQEAYRWANRQPTSTKLMRRRHSRAQFLRYATAWLRFLGRLEPTPTTPHRFGEQIAAFATFLGRDKGLVPSTIQSHCSSIRQFLDQLGPDITSLGDLNGNQVDEALGELLGLGRYARTTVRLLAHHLRSFFRFAGAKGWCHPGLANGIRGPRIFAQEPLPAGPSWSDVRRLVATTEGARPTDIRDRAIVMLLAVYGLRAGEVRGLRLENFDWNQGIVSATRGKTRSVQIYPLSRPVGYAVLRYLKEVRPHSVHREVFLTRLRPYRPLGSDAVGELIRRRLHALHLSLPHYGSHSLRHACATHLLEQGLSLKEIGDHLGHRDPNSTGIYAKVDLAGLRQVADLDLGDLL